MAVDGREEFLELLDSIRDTFLRKNAGYAGRNNPDPWANFRHSSGFGIKPADGVLVRISDKFSRLQALTRDPSNDQVGESREDSALDMAVYSLIYVCLLREEQRQMKEWLEEGLSPERRYIHHISAADHWDDELCYAPESHMTALCRPGNT